MFEAFRLEGSIGRDMSVNLDDALATKQALHTLGHFRTPSYGLTEYPDQPMIVGLLHRNLRVAVEKDEGPGLSQARVEKEGRARSAEMTDRGQV